MLLITAEEVRVIEQVRARGQIGVSGLARELGVHRSSLHYQVQSLVKKGVLRELKLSPRRTVYQVAESDQLKQVIRTQEQELKDLLLNTPRTRVAGKKPKLVFSDSYVMPAEMIARLKKDFEVVTYPDSPVRISEEAFIMRCKDADVVVTFFSVNITKEMLLQCPRLKCIISAAISQETIDVEACKELGIQVRSLDVHDNYKKAARTEFVFTSLFNILRLIVPQAEALRLGQFDYRGYVAEELRGKTVGVVGVNREGREIIPLLRAFGCGVMVANPDTVAVAPSDVGVAEYVPLASLFTYCDIVIFPESHVKQIHVDAKLLNKDMKARYFLFLSFSLTLDLDLVRSLILSGHITALVLDYLPDAFNVWDHFPKSHYRKIMNFPNVIVTPELGFYTVQSMTRNYQQVLRILQQLDLEVTV